MVESRKSRKFQVGGWIWRATRSWHLGACQSAQYSEDPSWPLTSWSAKSPFLPQVDKWTVTKAWCAIDYGCVHCPVEHPRSLTYLNNLHVACVSNKTKRRNLGRRWGSWAVCFIEKCTLPFSSNLQREAGELWFSKRK